MRKGAVAIIGFVINPRRNGRCTKTAEGHEGFATYLQ
jgi:hypothetical protein